MIDLIRKCTIANALQLKAARRCASRSGCCLANFVGLVCMCTNCYRVSELTIISALHSATQFLRKETDRPTGQISANKIDQRSRDKRHLGQGQK